MRYEYINSFVDSAQNIIESFVPSNIRIGPITLTDSLSAHGVSATIFLVGNIDGRVVLDLEPAVAKKIAGLMNNKDFDKIDRLVLDTICELTNIIIGKAVSFLNNKGFRFRPSPPCFFIGEKVYHGLEALCIRLTTEWGDISIKAAIKEKSGVL